MSSEPDELEHFSEVQQRRGADVQRSTKPIESHAPAAGVAFVAPAQAKASKALRTDATAVECYAAAIEAERQARLSEATTLYRRAFRLDPDVERSFHALALVQDKNESEAKPEDDALAFEFARTVQVAADYEEKAGKRVLTSDLRERLLRSIEANPYCRVEKIKDGAEEVEPMPADDQLAYHAVEAEGDAKVPLNRLPVEVIANILAHLALPANAQYFPRIEMLEARFGRLCRRARLDSLEQPLWRRVCQRVYRHPQVASPSTFDSLASRYAFDYRRMWIEHARVRTDGCYIGVQRYTRRGTAEGAWVNPSFAVTYFRFLRLYADGRCISLQSTVEPQDIVRQLQPGLRVIGLLEGKWTLTNGILLCRLEDLSKAPQQRVYAFQLEAKLKSSARGRMNKLEILRLATLRRETHEVEELPLSSEHGRPFYFSPVSSYEL